MKIIVVDDEPFFLEQLKRIIGAYAREEGVPIEVIAECYNGREALRRISETLPDAVISDIRMSAMDGIELAKTIQERWPNLPVVIISGYPSFDYAREAMRSNVVDYLLKPIDSAALKNVLGKLLRKIENEKVDQLGKMMQLVIRSSKEPPAAVIRELSEAIPSFRAIIVKNLMSQANPFLSGSPYNDEDTAFRSSLQPLLQANEEAWLFSSDHNKYFIIIMKVHHDDLLRWQQILRHIQRFFLHSSRHAPSLVCSRTLHDWSLLPAHIPELIKYLYEHTVIGRSRLIFHPDPQETIPDEAFQSELILIDEIRLTSLYQRRNWKDLKALIDEWMNAWKARQAPAVTVEISLKHIVRLLTQLNLTQTGERMILDSRVEEIIDVVQSHEELAEAFWTILKKGFVMEEAGEEDRDELRLIFDRIESYINHHLGRPLTLNELADKFYVSVSTLCNLFRDYSGKSFVEYVTALRMERAQAFMQTYPKMLNKEIAELVGYPDQNYFSRVFKSVAGVSPTDYRASLSR